jgi:hypothetical protein
MTANYRVVPTLQLGVEFNPVVGEVSPLATWFLFTETEERPAVFFGTSSDRIGSPEGTQAYYVTGAKYLPMLHLSPYASVNYSEWDQGWNIPFGANIELGRGLSLRPMYDGQRTHLLGTIATERFTATLIWAWLESGGAAVSFGF